MADSKPSQLEKGCQDSADSARTPLLAKRPRGATNGASTGNQYINLKQDYLRDVFEITNANGETPLMCAVDDGNIASVAILLKQHADVNAVDGNQRSCLHRAACKDESGAITKLLLR